jgi:metal-responsive CopG/Arc/MetJ family transcriptional regulator
VEESRKEPMERTSVTLPRSLATRLSYEANRRDTSASAVVRDALTQYFTGEGEPEPPAFIGMFSGGHGDTSTRVDELIAAYLDEQFEHIMGRGDAG